MINEINRHPLRKYFYGSKGPMILATLGTVILFLYGLISGNEEVIIPLIVIDLLIALVWWFVGRVVVSSSVESLYDECLKKDLEHFSQRALDKLGIISEQISIIEPIKVTGPFYDYEEVQRKKDAGRIALLKLVLIIAFLPIYLIYKGIKTIIHVNDYEPRLILKSGSDEKVRYSLVRAHVFLFSETQIYVYRVSYDICSGKICEECTSEYFYRDIDCVITGEEHKKILSKKKTIDKTFEYFKVIVTSGTNTWAYADAETSVLATQVMGMRELIRSKKEEING